MKPPRKPLATVEIQGGQRGTLTGRARLQYEVEIDGARVWLEWDAFKIVKPGKRPAGELNTNPPT